MTRFLTTCTAAALMLATGVAHAQMNPAPNATAPANPAQMGTAMARPSMPATTPAPMAAPMPAATSDKPMSHRAAMHQKSMRRMGHGRAMGRGVPTEKGSAAVDSLNDQSLARARNGQ